VGLLRVTVEGLVGHVKVTIPPVPLLLGGEVLVGTVVREVRGEVLQSAVVLLLLMLPLGLVAVAVAVGGGCKIQIQRPIMVRLLGVGSVSTVREPTVLLV